MRNLLRCGLAYLKLVSAIACVFSAHSLLSAPIDDAARQTVNVVSLQNATNFPVVVQQTESPRYSDGSFRPKRTVRTFIPGSGDPLVAFKDFNLFNTPIPVLPGSRLDFFPGSTDEKRFPIPLEKVVKEEQALVIAVFTKGWQANGDGVCTFILTVTNNRIRIAEIERKMPAGKMVKSSHPSFLKDNENFIYFDGDTKTPLLPGETKKEHDSTKIPTGFAAQIVIVTEMVAGKEVPLLRLAVRAEAQFMRAPAFKRV